MLKVISLTLMLTVLPPLSSAQAHYLWLEREGDGPVRAYFGEWIDDIREKTGGLLDRFKAPRVFVGPSGEPLPVKRNDNNLEFAAKGAGDVRFVDSAIPPREDKEKGQARSRIGAQRRRRQRLRAHVSRRAFAESRADDHRPIQMGEAAHH
jgi:hypothetical protein